MCSDRRRSGWLCVTILMVVALLAAPLTSLADDSTEKPLLTIGCLSDLHNQESLITGGDPHLRGTIVQTLTRMQEEEQVDVLLIGGDVTSDSYTTEANVQSILKQVQSYTDPLTKQVLWVTGNHDYNAGEGAERYNAAPYYDCIMKDSVGELPEEDAYYETYQGRDYLLAYHYVLNGFDFIGINTSPADMAGGLQNNNYRYTDGVFEWMEAKLAEIGAEKTVFVLGHLPIAGSNSLNSGKGMLTASSQRMIGIFKQYPHLLYLYGHDHGGNSAYIKEDTAQRVTAYDTNGRVIGGGNMTEPVDTVLSDALVWKFIRAGNGYTLKNLATGKYLGVASNLTTTTEPVIWILGQRLDGFTLQKEDGNSVHYSTNTTTFSHGDPTPLAFFEKKVMGGEVVYQAVDNVEDGGEYVVVANQTKALTNKLSPSNSERMAAMDVVLRTQEGIAPPAMGRFTVEKEGDTYRFVSENGGYLGYDGNLFVQNKEQYSEEAHINFTLSAGEQEGTFRLYNAGKDALHYGGSGWSLGNATDTVIYKLSDEGWTATNALTAGDTVFLQDAGSQKVLTAISNGSAGASRRLKPASLSAGKATIESVEQEPDSPKPVGEPSFITSFMGSMRYYNNNIDGFVGPTDSKVVQALMIYVYSDRIVLQMKNYGTANGGAQEISPYTIMREAPYHPPYSLGDVDQSGRVDVIDALMALQGAAGKLQLSNVQSPLADVDGVKGVSAYDALLILQYATKRIDHF